MSSLEELAADLAYAASAGSAKIAASVTASGNLEASTGFHGPQLPGPALRSVLARHSGRSTRSAGMVTEEQAQDIADHMAVDAGDQAAALLGGDRP